MNMPKQYAPFAVALAVGLAGFFAGDWSLLVWLLAAAIACAGVVLENARWGILASSVLGLGCSAYLFSRKLADASSRSLCNINDVINCDVVNNSAASELFGIPISLLGAGFFLGTAIAALAARDRNARLFSTTAVLSAIGMVYSLYLAWQAAQLAAVCPMCITIYLSTALLLWAGLRGLSQHGDKLGETVAHIPTSISFVAVSATLAVVVLVGLSTWSSRTSSSLPKITGTPSPPAAGATLSQQIAGLFTYSRSPVQLSGHEPVLGDPDAPYMLVEFADFGCPHCADASLELKRLVQQVPEIQVRFKPFALSGACNPALQGTEGAERCRAAMAAECAQQQNRFWDYASVVFENQRDLSDESLERAARQVGLDVAAWDTCRLAPETLKSIAESGMAGARAGVMGTPAIFVKGLVEGQWVEVCDGPPAVLALVNVRQRGAQLPAPTKQACSEGR